MIRVGNISGFYGDRLSAMREMLDGGEVDVLTGDYLAELTMLILGRQKLKDPTAGYARTFLKQAEQCLGTALERGVKIVVNAGGLNPAGLADAVRALGGRVAHVEGDDLLPRAADLGLTGALTANAYLGAWGIAACLRGGADVVVTGRVTDASLVVGAAAAHHGWTPDDLDALAGATAAGHVIECGTQATGGNYAFFAEVPDLRHPGFPIAEIAVDGSSVITKHPGTGGAVTVETVTAQLLYEIQGTAYLGPDVTTHFDTITLTADGPDRVRLSGVRGTPPPPTLKVCVNTLDGFRNSATFILTGLDIDAKAALVRSQLGDDITWTLARTDRGDADTQETASALLHATIRTPDAARAKAFSRRAVELALASYPGFTLTAPPTDGTPVGVYHPAYVFRADVPHTAVHHDGRREDIPWPERPIVGTFTGLNPASPGSRPQPLEHATAPSSGSAPGPSSSVSRAQQADPGAAPPTIPADPAPSTPGSHSADQDTVERATEFTTTPTDLDPAPPADHTQLAGSGTPEPIPAAVHPIEPRAAAVIHPAATDTAENHDPTQPKDAPTHPRGHGPRSVYRGQGGGGGVTGGLWTTSLPWDGPTRRVPLGTVAGARSGDKGGDANVGVWVREARAYSWLVGYLTVERVKELVPEARGLVVERVEFPNLNAVNFVIGGLLGRGVADGVRFDPQAKGLGEWIRSRVVDVPEVLL